MISICYKIKVQLADRKVGKCLLSRRWRESATLVYVNIFLPTLMLPTSFRLEILHQDSSLRRGIYIPFLPKSLEIIEMIGCVCGGREVLIFICLAAWGLSCSLGDLSLQHMDSLIVARGLSCPLRACGILVPQPGVKPPSPELQGKFLTTGPPEKSLCVCVLIWT